MESLKKLIRKIKTENQVDALALVPTALDLFETLQVVEKTTKKDKNPDRMSTASTLSSTPDGLGLSYWKTLTP